MAQNREVLLKKLTGLLKRITDTEDDYTVTADQRAALMELESLTWNYPTTTPQHQQARPSRPSSFSSSSSLSLSQASQDDDDDTEEDDDDESYYVDMVPYDMTERLKEVNRAFIEDPTPADCERAITVRFREVIADFQSPREYYPSDSDDGYGDSSDLLYDAEEEDGLTSLTSEVNQVLRGNVNVVDLTTEQHQEDDDLGDYLNIKESLDISAQDDDSRPAYKTLGVSDSKINWDDDNRECRRTEIPRLQLGDDQEAAHLSRLGDQTEKSVQVPSEKTLFEADDSGMADLEVFIKESDASEILENLLEESCHLDDGDGGKQSTTSVLEVSEGVHVDGNLKLGERDLGEETNSDTFFQRRESKELSEPSKFRLPARSDADFASLDYSDDFEDFQDEPECTEMEKQEEGEERIPAPAGSPQVSPVRSKTEPEMPPEAASKTPGHRSRRDQTPRKATGSGGEKNSSRRAKSNSPSEGVSRPSATVKGERVAAGPPFIKPALLSSDRFNRLRSNDSSRLRSRTSTASKSRPRSTVSSSSSSSPLSSASSSSSSSSSLSSHSSPHTRGGRGRASNNGPVRPTTHKTPAGHRVDGARGVNSSPVRPPTNAHLTLTPTNPGVRATPPAKVRKAASASDLHKVSEESLSYGRRRQNDEVFRAWLRQKNKQVAISRRHHHPPSSAAKNSAEVAERRKRAEEAFQAWLARKREQLKLEKKLRGERRRLEDQSRYARTKAECEVAYKEWCRRKRDEVRTTVRGAGGVPRSQSLERPWIQEKTRKLYTAYLNGH